MKSVVLLLLLSVALAAGLDQSKPDFSGKWTKILSSPGQAAETFTISQTATTLGVDDAGNRFVHKLDGSESKNVTKEGDVLISTTTWNGDSLVTRTPIRDARAPFVLTVVMRLDGPTLVIQATSTSESTGAITSQETKKYSKTPPKG